MASTADRRVHGGLAGGLCRSFSPLRAKCHRFRRRVRASFATLRALRRPFIHLQPRVTHRIRSRAPSRCIRVRKKHHEDVKEAMKEACRSLSCRSPRTVLTKKSSSIFPSGSFSPSWWALVTPVDFRTAATAGSSSRPDPGAAVGRHRPGWPWRPGSIVEGKDFGSREITDVPTLLSLRSASCAAAPARRRRRIQELNRMVEAAGVEPASERPVAPGLYMRSRTCWFATGVKARRKRRPLVREISPWPRRTRVRTSPLNGVRSRPVG